MRAPFHFIVVILCLIASAARGQATQNDDDARDKAMEAQEKAEFAKIEKATHIPDPAAGSRWQDVAREHHWDKSAIDAIARDKVLFGGREYRQIFTPYVEPAYPQFITTDSVLNAYHVLYEETVREMELANSRRLSDLLKNTWTNLAKIDARVAAPPELAARAKRRAQITVAVALTLIGGKLDNLDPALAPIVAAEVKKVLEATAVEKPSWLGPPNADVVTIEYSRFTVRGFYTQSPQLESYFRTVAWLQAIPFLAQDNEQLLSAAMIALSATTSGGDSISDLFQLYDQMLGERDDPDLRDVVDALNGKTKIDVGAGDLDHLHQDLVEAAKMHDHMPLINDQLSDGRDPPALSIRVFPARRTPDAVMFERLMKHSTRQLPSGLDVATALGCSYAWQRLPHPLETYARLYDPATVGQGTLYCDYLDCLASLLDPPDKDAPKVFSSAIWQEKTCQTILSGWAQLRHTWQLQAKENVSSFGAFIGPPGFVEPAPDFYTRMAALCDRTADLVRRTRAGEPNADDHAIPDAYTPDLRERWHNLSGVCQRLNALAQKQLRGTDFNQDDTKFIFDYGHQLASVMLYDSNSYEVPRDDAPRIADVYRNPNINQYLEVGVGRPRSFYILYPYHGGEVLCEGAVMPYYEFPHDTPMTDAAWMDMLNSKSPPKPMFPQTQP